MFTSFLAEITNGLSAATKLALDWAATPQGRCLVGLYLGCLLTGLVLDVVFVRRWLAARRGERAGDAVIFMPLPERTRGCARLRERPWTWREVNPVIIVLLGVQLVIQGAALIIKKCGLSVDALVLTIICQGLGFHGLGLLTLGWFMRRRRMDWDQAWGIRWRELGRRTGQGILAFVMILPLVLAASLLNRAILAGFGYPFSIQPVVEIFMQPLAGGLLAFLVLLALVVAPLAEEALFRGMLLPALARSLGILPAVLLTAVCFALLHFSVSTLFPIFVLAAGLAFAYIATGSLWVPIVMHALFNGLNVSLILSVVR
jgi:membrane protease YdiL (CAAX protease family)